MGFCLFDCWPLLLQSYNSLFQVLNFISDCKSCFVLVFVYDFISYFCFCMYAVDARFT